MGTLRLKMSKNVMEFDEVSETDKRFCFCISSLSSACGQNVSKKDMTLCP